MDEEFFMNVPPGFTCFAGRDEVDVQIFPYWFGVMGFVG